MRASNMTAVSFHVRLFNHAPYPVEVEVLDFNSDLGDFVVEPEKILIQPNASAETEPMTSRLGVTSDAIPLSVTIRYKGQAPTHMREKQVLVLKPVAAPAKPDVAAPAQVQLRSGRKLAPKPHGFTPAASPPLPGARAPLPAGRPRGARRHPDAG
jgi:hypothetical protein